MTQFGNKRYLDRIITDLNVHNVKQVYQELCRFAAEETGANPAVLFGRLMEKENRETSGIGDGVAIPHLSLDGISRGFMAFAQLQKPVDFNAIDTRPVDLVFLLISPAKDGPLHLSRLAGISRLFRNRQLRHHLRSTKDEDVLQALLLDPQNRSLAA